MTTKTLDKIIESNGCNGYDVNAAMVEAVAIEYADSPEVKRRHWDEFCLALAKDDLVPIIDETGWMSESMLDRGDDLESLYVRLGLVG